MARRNTLPAVRSLGAGLRMIGERELEVEIHFGAEPHPPGSAQG